MTDNDRLARVRRTMRPLLCVVIALASLAAQRLPQRPDPLHGLIVGRVVDPEGRAVAGAVVVLTRGGGNQRPPLPGRAPAPPPPPSDRILTGADGYFVFRGLPTGTFALTAVKSGYSEAAFGRRRPGGPSQQLSLTDTAPRREVALLIWKHGAINGAVSDESGEPLIGITIQAFKRAEVNGVRRFAFARRAATDDRGIYRLHDLTPGDYVIAVFGRQVAVPLSTVQESDRDRRPAPMTDSTLGTIPVPGNASGLQLGETAYSLPPDGVTPPPPEDDRIWVYPPTFHPALPTPTASATVTLRSAEERDGIDLQLRPVRTRRVSGFLTGPADMLAMRRLRLVPADAELLDAGEPITSTDVRGAFTFPAVPAGDYLLRMVTRSADWRGEPERGTHWAEVPITVDREDLSGVNVVLRPASVVTGTLVFDGASRPRAAGLQASIVVERANGGLPGGEAASFASIDDLGRFTAAGLAAGQYYVRVLDSPIGWMFKGAMYNGRDLSEHAVEVREDLAGVNIEFTDRWTGLRGIVTGPNGQTDSAALVLLFTTDSSRWRSFTPGARRLRSARVGANGEFAFTSIPVGEYYLATIGDEDGADWQDPGVLDTLSRSATRITINDGEQKSVTLRRRDSRR